MVIIGTILCYNGFNKVYGGARNEKFTSHLFYRFN